MDGVDVKNLKKLVKIIRKDNTKEGALTRLINAGIFDREGNYTKNYPTLAALSKRK